MRFGGACLKGLRRQALDVGVAHCADGAIAVAGPLVACLRDAMSHGVVDPVGPSHLRERHGELGGPELLEVFDQKSSVLRLHGESGDGVVPEHGDGVEERNAYVAPSSLVRCSLSDIDQNNLRATCRDCKEHQKQELSSRCHEPWRRWAVGIPARWRRDRRARWRRAGRRRCRR